MIITALIWIYIIITSYVCGVAVLSLLGQEQEGMSSHISTCILAGVGVIIVYSQIISLVTKVGLTANIILVLATVVFSICFKNEIMSGLRSVRIWTDWKKALATIILFLLFAYGTSHGYMHYDSDLYHAQSIHWIEDYGVVTGLGNVHSRLAYNSSAFCFTALFSMSFLLGQSYHVCAGFLCFMVSILCMDLFKKGEILKPSISNFVRVVALYYLLMIFDEMVSPASDYFMVLLLIVVVLGYADLFERKVKDAFPYAILSLMALVVLTVKISGALIVLIAVYPLYLLIKDKDIHSIVKYIVAGIITVVPFIGRNIILSGYLVYPVTAVDIFNMPYKIPVGMAEYDAREIQVYGRGYTDVLRFEEPLSKWLPDWISSLGKVDKAAFVLSVLAIAALVAMIIYYLIKMAYEVLPGLYLLLVVSASFTFWLLTSPNLRYGCIYLYLTPALVFGWIYSRLVTRAENGVFFRIVLSLFFFYKAIAFIQETASLATDEYLLRQQDYGVYETVPYTVNQNTFFRPAEGDQTGYYDFPSTVTEGEFTMISDNISDGFMPKSVD